MQGVIDEMKIKLYRVKNTKETKKNILHEIKNQNGIINNVTAKNNNKSKETQTELSIDIEKENQESKTLN